MREVMNYSLTLQLEKDQDILGSNPTFAKILFVQFIQLDKEFGKNKLERFRNDLPFIKYKK